GGWHRRPGKSVPWPDGPGKSLWATPAGAVGTAGRENPSVAGQARKIPLGYARRGGWHRRPGKSLCTSCAGILDGLTAPGAVELPKIPERPLRRDFIAPRGRAREGKQ